MMAVLLMLTMEKGTNPAGTFWQIIYSLFMFGIVVFLAVIVTRMWAKRGGGLFSGPNRLLHVLEQLSLGPGRSVCLIKAADKILLLGVGEKEIRVLSEYPLTAEFEELASPEVKSASAPRWLRSMTERASRAKTRGDEGGFLREMRKELERFKDDRS